MKNKEKKTVNIPPKSPIDELIHSRKIFIKGVMVSKPDNTIVVLLGGGVLSRALGGEISFKLSEFSGLKSANEEELNNWELVGGGMGIHWENLDEDLSLKGFIISALKKIKLEMSKAQNSKEYKTLTAAVV